MGGNMYGVANSVGSLAEFNFHGDVVAAEMVLREFQPKTELTIATLEFTLNNPFPPSVVENISNQTVLGNLFKNIAAKDISRYYSGLNTKMKHQFDDKTGFRFYDLLAVIVALHPDTVLKSWNHTVAVELEGKFTRGLMVIDRNELILDTYFGKANIPAEVDVEKILALKEMQFS